MQILPIRGMGVISSSASPDGSLFLASFGDDGIRRSVVRHLAADLFYICLPNSMIPYLFFISKKLFLEYKLSDLFQVIRGLLQDASPQCCFVSVPASAQQSSPTLEPLAQKKLVKCVS